MCGPLCVRMTSAVGIEDPRFSLLPVYKKDTGGSRDTHGTRTGHTGAHGHTDHTDEPHNHPNPTTHPHDHATAETAADSTAAAVGPEAGADRSPRPT